MCILLISQSRLIRETLQACLASSSVALPVQTASFAGAPWADAAPLSLMVVSAYASDGLGLVAEFRGVHPMSSVAVLALDGRDEEFIAWASIGISGYVEPEAPAEHVVSTIIRVANGEIVYPDRLSSLLLSHLARRTGLARPQAGISQLTRRELDIIKLLADGQANKQIARRLAITDATVKNHVHSILEKLGLRSRGEAAAYYRKSASFELITARLPHLSAVPRDGAPSRHIK